jgi:uncharacterized protein (UPF0332 family)
MSDDPQDELILYRLQQADESIQEAKTLAQNSLWRGAINRAYYAMFYAALALVVQKQQVISKHSGVIVFFDKEFVRNGILPKELSRYLHFAFERRQNSDYGEIFTVNSEEANQAIIEAGQFVEKVKDYLCKV